MVWRCCNKSVWVKRRIRDPQISIVRIRDPSSVIENSLRGTKITHSVVGIGINVNQIQFAEYEPPATSFAKIEVKEFELRKLLDELIENLDKWYTRVRLGHFRQINQAYEEAMFQRNKHATNQTPEGKYQGTIT